ncbi:MAG: polymer-forming cytoskeletal protein [Thermomicrobiales bacterium]
MVFRRDKQGGDAFQRQISALRQQLGSGPDDEGFEDAEATDENAPYAEQSYASGRYEQQDASYQRQEYQPDYAYEEETSISTFESQVPAIPAIDSQVTVINHDTTWKGEVSSEGSMHILGRYDGVIRAKEDVYILDEAMVSAEVHARNVVVSGRYDGEVTCDTRFEVLPTGRVNGSVRAPVLVVHDGAEINGSIQMTNLETPRQAPTSLVRRREASTGPEQQS